MKIYVINSHKNIIFDIFNFKTVEGCCTIQNQIITILKKKDKQQSYIDTIQDPE